MAEMVDQPLDAYIRSNKRGRGRGRGRGFRGRSRGRGRSTFRRGGGRGGRGGSFTRQPRQMGDKWQHDMYENGSVGGPPTTPTRGSNTAGTGKLHISNLDYGVSDDDIKDLFQEFGRLRKAEVHYDRSGRSLGTAQVLFERRVDALKAAKQYNGVPLDGRPMTIQLMDGIGQKTSTSTPNKGTVRQRIGSRSSRGTSNGRGRGGGRGRGRRGRGGKREPVPTAEELDADLEAYRDAKS